MEEAARQMLRAIRGDRSQAQLSRRLGYRSNVVADWEGGHRFPAGAEALRACAAVGIDVAAALRRFHARTAADWSPGDAGLAAWLRALQGSISQVDLAARSGTSRYQVHRWLSGQTRPRLPELLVLVDALTGRAPDWAAELAPIEKIPAFMARYEASIAGRTLGWTQPWALAVLALLEAGVPEEGAAERIAARLGLPAGEAAGYLDALQAAGLASPEGGAWRPRTPLTLNAPSDEALRALRAHWADVARARLGRPEDLFSFNLFGVSRADLERIRGVQREAFREIRSIVAASSPVETVGLVVLQTCELAAPEEPGGDG